MLTVTDAASARLAQMLNDHDLPEDVAVRYAQVSELLAA